MFNNVLTKNNLQKWDGIGNGTKRDGTGMGPYESIPVQTLN